MPDQKNHDIGMMQLALREARKGQPSPNPHVGAVIVQNGQVIALGHHERAGLAHAEVAAMVQAQTQTHGATLYVTFEPCNHHGRTGPCTDAIIQAGIKRVVIGCHDPAPHVPGAVEKLRAQGIEVCVGVCEKQARALTQDFIKHFTTGLPWVTLKAALTLDGRIATRSGHSQWITGEKARKKTHAMRAHSDAVLVGVGTVLQDNPQLTVRHVPGLQPVRVVLDTMLRTPVRAKLFERQDVPVLIMHGSQADAQRAHALQMAGAQLVQVSKTDQGLVLREVLAELGRRNVVKLLVEGGSGVYSHFLQQQYVDQLVLFYGPRILADTHATPFVTGSAFEHIDQAWQLDNVRVRRYGQDVCIKGTVRHLGCGPSDSGLHDHNHSVA